ncbi:MAG: hypothetical protein JSW06_01980 [Thermoplasmatales archaeon]|nr:MAG: hypothetical protein JSW06_01980 [Thermoplasmatales archaeon]
MKRNNLIKKGVAVTIILLFIGVSVPPSISGNNNHSRNVENIDFDEHSHSDITVTITYPEDGIYCNNQKIFPFFVTLVICGDLGFDVEIETSPYVEIDYVEFYINDVLMFTDNSEPFEFGPYCLNIPFSKIKSGIIAYATNGDQGSDEIVIWRIFR